MVRTTPMTRFAFEVAAVVVKEAIWKLICFADYLKKLELVKKIGKIRK